MLVTVNSESFDPNYYTMYVCECITVFRNSYFDDSALQVV